MTTRSKGTRVFFFVAFATHVGCISAVGAPQDGEQQADPGGSIFAGDDAITAYPDDAAQESSAESATPPDPGTDPGSDPGSPDPSDPSDPSNPGSSGGSSGPTCASGKTLCDGACVDTSTNRNDCGACGRKCALNATGCSDGHCTCIDGQHACGTECVNLHWNEANCGSCGHACAAGKKCCDGWCKTSC